MAGQHDHVLRSNAALLFFGLVFLATVGGSVYLVGFEVRDWHLSGRPCARAVGHDRVVAYDGMIRVYTGRVVQRPGDGVLSVTEPGGWEQLRWDAGDLLFISDEQGAIFAVRLAPSVPEGATISFCGVDHGAAALWPEVGQRSGSFGLQQPVWGEPAGGYHKVRWIDGTALY